MDNILKDLDAVFRLISSIPVTGEAVDVMATARNTLRKVYAELENKDKGAEGND